MASQPSGALSTNNARMSSVRRMRQGAPGVSCSPAMNPSPSQRCKVDGASPSSVAASATVSSSPSCGWSAGWWQGILWWWRSDWTLLAVHGDVHLVEQAAQQLFAVLVGGGGCRPHAVEVVTEGEDRLFLLRGQGFRACVFAAGECLLGVGHLLQRGVPLGLQASGDQAVVGVDGPVAALGFAGVVAGLLDLPPPLRERGVVAVLELLGGG